MPGSRSQTEQIHRIPPHLLLVCFQRKLKAFSHGEAFSFFLWFGNQRLCMSTPSPAFKGQDQTPEVGECRGWGISLTGVLLREKQIPATTGMTDELQTLCFLHQQFAPHTETPQSRTPSCPLPGWDGLPSHAVRRKLRAAGFASSLSQWKKKKK